MFLLLNNMRKLFFAIVIAHLGLLPNITQAVALTNPLGETDVRQIFGRVISAVLSIVGSVALLMFVYGGVLWLTSRGDAKQIQKGKDTLTWATLGIVIIFASYVLVNALIVGITTGSAT